jgi:hypothetical protein
MKKETYRKAKKEDFKIGTTLYSWNQEYSFYIVEQAHNEETFNARGTEGQGDKVVFASEEHWTVKI